MHAESLAFDFMSFVSPLGNINMKDIKMIRRVLRGCSSLCMCVCVCVMCSGVWGSL